MMNAGEYVWPVLELELIDGALKLRSYRGCCFFVGEPRLLVSCRHVLEDNACPAVQSPNDGLSYRVRDVWYHPRLDLAIARMTDYHAMTLSPLTRRLTLGADVSAFAYLSHTMDGKSAAMPTIAKGYISEIPRSLEECDKGLGIYSLSFPSLAGYSGAPVTLFGSTQFAGMLFGNHQSDVTVFSNEEVNDDGSVWRERVVRVIDQGEMIGYGEIMKAIEVYRAEFRLDVQ